MAQTQQIIGSYPLPDPDWDYSVLWVFLNRCNLDLQILLNYISQYEQASPETNKAIGIQLEAIAESIRVSLDLLKHS
jgi:hypothetical protein